MAFAVCTTSLNATLRDSPSFTTTDQHERRHQGHCNATGWLAGIEKRWRRPGT